MLGTRNRIRGTPPATGSELFFHSREPEALSRVFETRLIEAAYIFSGYGWILIADLRLSQNSSSRPPEEVVEVARSFTNYFARATEYKYEHRRVYLIIPPTTLWWTDEKAAEGKNFFMKRYFCTYPYPFNFRLSNNAITFPRDFRLSDIYVRLHMSRNSA